MPSARVWGGSRGWEGAICRLQTPRSSADFPKTPCCVFFFMPFLPARSSCIHTEEGTSGQRPKIKPWPAHHSHSTPPHTLILPPPTGSSSLNGVCLSQLPRVGSALLFLQLGHCLLARVLEGSIPAHRSGLRPPQPWGGHLHHPALSPFPCFLQNSHS